MIVEIYTVKDELANRFLEPIMMKGEELAKRQFKLQINNIDLWKSNSSDFSLYRLGTYDDETGKITNNIEKICGGRSVLD